jgi:hypothetical protein
MTNVFVSILRCCQIGDHPQGDLSTYGYRPTIKV